MLVTTPVCARCAEELDGLDQPRARQVRAAAHVHEPILAVERYSSIGDVRQQLQLVLLAHFLIGTDGLLARDLYTLDRLVAFGQFSHPGLDLLEVLGRKRPAEIDVIVEAIVDRRPDR